MIGLSIAYFVASAIELYIEYAEEHFLRYFIKPIPIFMLIAFAFKFYGQTVKLIRAGLILSVIGDILLSFQDEKLFLLGTTFFFGAHILYIAGFTKGRPDSRPIASTSKIVLFFCILLTSVTILSSTIMWDIIPDKIIFLPYGVIITSMVIVALLRQTRTTTESFVIVLLGAVLFFASDNTIAFFKFNKIKSSNARIFIMLTYYLAQYFITMGIWKHDEPVKKVHEN